jgi:hypothetical protein
MRAEVRDSGAEGRATARESAERREENKYR